MAATRMLYMQGRLRGRWRITVARMLTPLGYLSSGLLVRVANRLLAGVVAEVRVGDGPWRRAAHQPHLRLTDADE